MNVQLSRISAAHAEVYIELQNAITSQPATVHPAASADTLPGTEIAPAFNVSVTTRTYALLKTACHTSPPMKTGRKLLSHLTLPDRSNSLLPPLRMHSVKFRVKLL